jgi:2-dehydropantoate 2-reductase
MRFIIYGVGAIGGTVAAALARQGENVVGIARGAQLEAIRRDGLLFRTPGFTGRVRFACAASPSEIAFGADDVVFLTMKSQDTAAALLDLRAAGVDTQPILCAQNGVANEPMALRFFANVYGVTVMMPADYVVPGEVNAFGSPRHGIFEVGRYPIGTDDLVERVCAALQRAGIAGEPARAVMEGKYGKLLLNLGNVIEAALGSGVDRSSFQARAMAEAEAVYRAAGIAWRDVGDDERRKSLMRVEPIGGVARTGGSSTQSLARAAGSIETDYLNGEIVLLGRLHGVPTPLNAALCRLGHELLAARRAPGAITPGELDQLLLRAA